MVAHQPDLGLDFIRETALRLGCPCMPTTPAQQPNDSPTHDPQAQSPPSTSAGYKLTPAAAPALPAAAAAEEAGSSSGGEDAGTPRETSGGLPEGPATPPSRGRSGHGPLPPDAALHSPVSALRSASAGLAIDVPRDGGGPSMPIPDSRLNPHAA